MKKLILAGVLLASAFAFTSCCSEGYCPKNMRCFDRQGGDGYDDGANSWFGLRGFGSRRQMDDGRGPPPRGCCPSCGYNWLNDTPYRWDSYDCFPRDGGERTHRYW